MREVLDGDAEGTSETEICKFEQTLSVDQQVLGLEVAMKDFVSMALFNSI